MNAFLYCQPLRGRSLRAITHEQELCRNILSHAIKNLDHVQDTLYGPKIRNVHEYALALRSIFGAAVAQFLIAAVQIAIDEVVNHLNVVTDAEFGESAGAKVV